MNIEDKIKALAVGENLNGSKVRWVGDNAAFRCIILYAGYIGDEMTYQVYPLSEMTCRVFFSPMTLDEICQKFNVGRLELLDEVEAVAD